MTVADAEVLPPSPVPNRQIGYFKRRANASWKNPKNVYFYFFNCAPLGTRNFFPRPPRQRGGFWPRPSKNDVGNHASDDGSTVISRRRTDRRERKTQNTRCVSRVRKSVYCTATTACARRHLPFADPVTIGQRSRTTRRRLNVSDAACDSAGRWSRRPGSRGLESAPPGRWRRVPARVQTPFPRCVLIFPEPFPRENAPRRRDSRPDRCAPGSGETGFQYRSKPPENPMSQSNKSKIEKKNKYRRSKLKSKPWKSKTSDRSRNILFLIFSISSPAVCGTRTRDRIEVNYYVEPSCCHGRV